MQLTKICLYVFLILGVPAILFYGAPLMIPLAVAIILAMMLNPAIDKMMKWGINENLAIGISVLAVIGIGVALTLAVIGQASAFANDWESIREQFSGQWKTLQNTIAQRTGIDANIIEDRLSFDAKELTTNLPARARGIAGSIFGIIGNILLVLVYLVFLLLERHRFTKFIFKISDSDKKSEASEAIDDMLDIAQGYLVGKLALVGILALIYSVGFMIIGLKYGIFLAILAAILSIIPYLGNIIGGILAMVAALVTSGGVGAVIGVVIVMGIAQFVESYVVQPFLVGSKVNLNPFVTIISVIAFGLIWGVVGTILAIPLVGMMKVVFDHLERFKPLGYVMGDE